jgi:hypothetical protein
MNADHEALRRAATKLREHARSLPWTMTGPWSSRSGSVIADDGTDVGMLVVQPYNPKDDPPLMAFIALMNPPVALALAGLLAGTAERDERDREFWSRHHDEGEMEAPQPGDELHEALTVANAVLGLATQRAADDA